MNKQVREQQEQQEPPSYRTRAKSPQAAASPISAEDLTANLFPSSSDEDGSEDGSEWTGSETRDYLPTQSSILQLGEQKVPLHTH